MLKCILLTYSYFGFAENGLHLNNKNKKIDFCFVLSSIYTIFAEKKREKGFSKGKCIERNY